MTRRRLRSLVSFAIVGLGLLAWWATARLDREPDAGSAGAAAPAPLGADWYDARPVIVQDGDSFVARHPDGRQVTIRVAGIDAPERSQPHADEARRALRALLDRPGLRIRAGKVDRYGREVSEVSAGGSDVGLELIEAGHAWHFARYAREQRPEQRGAYAAAEQRARSAHRGLWQDPQPLAPWLFREKQRSTADAAATR